MTNRKLHMCFRLAPRSMTLDDHDHDHDHADKFELLENSAAFRRIRRQQLLNE